MDTKFPRNRERIRVVRKWKTESPAQIVATPSVRRPGLRVRLIRPPLLIACALSRFSSELARMFAALTILLSAPGPSMASSQSQCMNHCAYYASVLRQGTRADVHEVVRTIAPHRGTREKSKIDYDGLVSGKLYSPPRNWIRALGAICLNVA